MSDRNINNNEQHEFHVFLNGESRNFMVRETETLLQVIRDRAKLTGTKRGCDGGHCGACTVLVNDKPMNSCSLLALQVDGASITTIEGLAVGNEPSDLQLAFVEANAVQCGFCTPGMLLSAEALLRSNSNPSDEEIDYAMSGNLCRCTGYVNIRKAIRLAALWREEERHGSK
ncbi:MAG: (2Fe-2S)-binding protein [Clostridiaceae bacterium]|nr:(2Fe-2S)-binding protein [Clostridiaceae bacterium]